MEDRAEASARLEQLKTRFLQSGGASLSQEFVRLSGNSIGIRVIGAVFGFGFNVVLSRTLGTTGTGVAMFYLNFATLIGLIATGGMDVVGLRELSRHGDDRSRAATVLGHVLANTLWSAILFSGCAFVFLRLFGNSLSANVNVWVYLMCTLILFFSTFQKTLSDWLIAFGDFRASQITFYLLNRVASVTLSVVIIAVVGIAGASSGTFIFVYLIGSSFAVLYGASRVFTHVSWRDVGKTLSPSMILFRQGLACGMQNTAFILLTLSPFVLLGALSSATQVGMFGVSQRLVALMVLTMTTISQLAMRDVSRAFGNGDIAALARTLTTCVRLTFGLAVGLTIPLMAFAPVWVLIFGKHFAEASPTLVILSAGICAQCFGMPFQAVLFSTNNEIYARNVTIISAAVGIGLNILFIPSWGAPGAALGTGVGLLLQSIGHGACALRILPIRFEIASLRLAPRYVALNV